MCDAERAWLKCTNRQKLQLKQKFVKKRKSFDQHVQRRKRAYWFEMQNEILYNASYNQNEFWKSMGRVGVRNNRKKGFPREILDTNGNAIKDSNVVFDKWKTEFCGLLNPSDDQQPNLDQTDIMQRVDINVDESAFLTREFSLLDVQKLYVISKQPSGLDR